MCVRKDFTEYWNNTTIKEDLLVINKCDISCSLVVLHNRPRAGLSVLTSLPVKKGILAILLLSLSGDVQLNPGPALTHSNVSLYYMNARSIADNKLTQFNTVFADNSDFDVICLSETWLHAGVFDGEILDDSQFCVHRRDRSQLGSKFKRGGGVLTAVSTRYTSRARGDLESDKCEAVWCEIELNSKSKLLIGCCYLPPKQTTSSMDDFQEMMTRVHMAVRPGDTLLLCGDFNMPSIRWTRRSCDEQVLIAHTVDIPNAVDTCFLNVIEESDLVQHVPFPTRDNNFLDLLFTSNHDATTTVKPAPRAVKSDHDAFHCSMAFPFIGRKSFTIRERLNWTKVKYDELSAAISSKPWDRLLECSDVNEKCNIFYDLVNEAIRDSVPVISVNPAKYPAWFDNETVNALKDKNRAYRKWKRTVSENLRIEYQVKRAYFKHLKVTKYNAYISKIEAGLNHDSRALWKYVGRKTKSPRVPMEVDYNGIKGHDPNSCSELFSEFFRTKFRPPRDVSDPLPKTKSFTSNCLSDLHVEQTEVEKCLKELKNGKSPGPDGLPVSVFKNCRQSLSGPLTDIFNSALQTGVFPVKWKLANVIPVLKKGSRFQVTNYRPISLLCIMSKVFESVLHRRMYAHVSQYIAAEQHGFVKGRSTVTNLSKYTHFISKNINNKVQVDSVYTDFSSAFDSVDHSLLLHKLKSYGIVGKLHKLLSSYLSNRTQIVTINSGASRSEFVTSGVPQGSILGPLMFVIFVNDLPSCFNHSSSLMFADDLKIFRPIIEYSDCERLQHDIEHLSRWCTEWRLNLNIAKCNVISFTNKKNSFIYNYSLNGSLLDRVKYIRDLGVVLSQDMSFNKHIQKIVPNAFKLLGFVRRSCMKEFRPNTLRCLYVSLVRPQIEYASVIWNPNNSHGGNVSCIEAVQRRYIRYICYKTNTVYDRANYQALCDTFRLTTLFKRRQMCDLIFLFKIIRNYFNDLDIISNINFRVPPKNTRNHDTFVPSRSRINVFKYSCFTRLQTVFNDVVPDTVDVFNIDFKAFKSLLLNLDITL